MFLSFFEHWSTLGHANVEKDMDVLSLRVFLKSYDSLFDSLSKSVMAWCESIAWYALRSQNVSLNRFPPRYFDYSIKGTIVI
jgi:hypothetical protein